MIKRLMTPMLMLMLATSFAQGAMFDDILISADPRGFKDADLAALYSAYSQDPNQQDYQRLQSAVLTPFVSENPHTGDKFFETLAWYRDLTAGNRDGQLTLQELEDIVHAEAQTYLGHLQQGSAPTIREQSWKWLQKLAILRQEIQSKGWEAYPYTQMDMKQIDHDSQWNAAHTIDDIPEFNQRVLLASHQKPVLVKFGLTYCIHCLLLEHLGSVPAVHERYQDVMDVYKLWWNPHAEDMAELNYIAQSQGVKSSPFFILYHQGQIIQSGYAFPDENGLGMEEFLAPILP